MTARPSDEPPHLGRSPFDVWEEQEQLDAFGLTLMPILSAAGADPGEPMVAPLHNVIVG